MSEANPVDIRPVEQRQRAFWRQVGFWAPSLGLAAILIAIGLPPVRSLIFPVEEAPAVRGERLAGELGCFTCHGAGGLGGVPNQKAHDALVPGFAGDRGLAHSKSRDDLRAFIRDGAPEWRKRDPDYQAAVKWAAFRMPAYGEVLSASQTEDLVAYVWLASQRDRVLPEEPLARRGAEIAREQGCFHCHGPLGVGGQPNPGSLKGYIPGFWGGDFEDLVRDDGELRAWIEAGRLERVAEHPIGKRFFTRQRVVMPPFGQFLASEDIEALIAYVRWLRVEGPRQFAETPS
jgi:mono/diheme cytochrome c family protein